MPPTVFPRSVQVARTLKGLRALGWSGTVITPAIESFPRAAVDQALAAAYGTHYTLRTVDLSRIDMEQASWAARLKARVSGELELSDSELWVSRAAKAALAEISQRSASALITFGQPWTDHLIGLRIRQRHPKLHWVAHFSDPWTDSPYSEVTGEARE